MAITTTLTGMGRGFAAAPAEDTASKRRKEKKRMRVVIDCDSN
jgi:hypothetical protein